MPRPQEVATFEVDGWTLAAPLLQLSTPFAWPQSLGFPLLRCRAEPLGCRSSWGAQASADPKVGRSLRTGWRTHWRILLEAVKLEVTSVAGLDASCTESENTMRQ